VAPLARFIIAMTSAFLFVRSAAGLAAGLAGLAFLAFFAGLVAFAFFEAEVPLLIARQNEHGPVRSVRNPQLFHSLAHATHPEIRSLPSSNL
jgi:hypothetical protein